MIMRLRFIRVGGKLHWYVDSKNGFLGWSYPVFHRRFLPFVFRLFFCRSFRRQFLRDFCPSVSDFENAKSLQEWYDSLPSNPSIPLHDILES